MYPSLQAIATKKREVKTLTQNLDLKLVNIKSEIQTD